MSNAAVNIMYKYLSPLFSVLWDTYLGVESLGHEVILYSTFWEAIQSDPFYKAPLAGVSAGVFHSCPPPTTHTPGDIYSSSDVYFELLRARFHRLLPAPRTALSLPHTSSLPLFLEHGASAPFHGELSHGLARGWGDPHPVVLATQVGSHSDGRISPFYG